MRPRHRPQNLGIVLLCLAVWWKKAVGAEGYAVLGYLTYTRFDTSGQPTHKNVLMFDVQVHGADWRIRTEPVIEGNGGIGFYEASHREGVILMVTALETASSESESPFQSLRAELKASKAIEVYFSNPPPPRAVVSNAVSAAVSSRPTVNASNVAVAVALKGNFPRVDQSYVAFLWFAFTSPGDQAHGTSNALLQIWDDGQPQKVRFRHAKWNEFNEAPNLVSSAEYHWSGKQLHPSGRLEEITTSSAKRAGQVAARYEVPTATNFAQLRLPLEFRLIRYAATEAEAGKEIVSSTMVGTVVDCQTLSASPSDPELPGRTFVTDYRASAEELKGSPVGYLHDSNALPTVEQVKRSKFYLQTLAAVKTSSPRTTFRWMLLALLLVPPVGVIFWKWLAKRRVE
ncbi:MAG: hypothetical protein KIS67_24545 [Verrucomicrobiae bacterium]|nr:hypothetical protein [Verrucomicrobiae bacterium]